MPTAADRVIIRVWTSRYNREHKGENVGHISLQTPNRYMSLWPTSLGKQQGLGIFKPINHELKDDYQADLDEERRDPEVTICLYTLDHSRMEEYYDTAACQLKGWALIGRKLVNQNSAASCSSLAYDVLKAGGIYDMISALHSSRFSSVVTPDDLATVIKAAKRYELKLQQKEQWPNPNDFIYTEGEETDVTQNNTCLVM